jgi:hypothetical protein
MFGMRFFQCASSDVLFFFQNTTEDGLQCRESGAGYSRRIAQQTGFESSDTQTRV